MKVKLITYSTGADKIVAAAAKLCYSESKPTEIYDTLTDDDISKMIGILIKLGHESPVEHLSFTFALEDVSRSLLAQITRHRIASFSVQSQRYVSMDNTGYVIPPEINNITEAKDVFIKAMKYSKIAYKKLHKILSDKHYKTLSESGKYTEKECTNMASKMANEDARFVMPNASETQIMMTMNTRELFHFFNLRCCNRAQWEIRDLATEMLKQCKEVSPILFKYAGPSCVKSGCSEGKMTCGKAKEVKEKFLNMKIAIKFKS